MARTLANGNSIADKEQSRIYSYANDDNQGQWFVDRFLYCEKRKFVNILAKPCKLRI